MNDILTIGKGFYDSARLSEHRAPSSNKLMLESIRF